MRRWLFGWVFGLGIFCLMWQGGVPMMWAMDDAPLAGKRIAVDAGHGGIDSGAEYHAQAEKDINLVLAKRIGDKLISAGAEVVYTRTDDVDYYTRGKGGKRADLKKRVAIIEEARPDVFVSVHCNASTVKTYQGAQVFYHPKNENSRGLAEMMQKRMTDFPEGNHRQAQANTHVLLLSSLSMPGVLLEAGYLSNGEEAQLLCDESYQNRLAEAILATFMEYFTEKRE